MGAVMAGLGRRAGVVLILSTVIATPTPQSPLGEARNATSCGGREALNETLSELMEDYFQWKLQTYPEWATLEGFPGFNHLVEDFSMDGILAKGEKCQEFLDRSCLVGEQPTKGSTAAMHKNIFETELRTCVNGMRHKGYLLPPINFLEGFQVEYPRLISDKKRTPLGSLKDYEDLLARLKQLPQMVRQVEALLKEGVTYARESLGGVDAQFEKLQVGANNSDFYVRFRDMPGSLGRHVVGRMQSESYATVAEELLPALRELQEYIKYEYSSRVRSHPGVFSMQDGRDFYDAVLQWHTSTQMTPQEVHDMGLEEVASIRNGVDQLLVQLGAGNKTFQQFATEARSDPSQRFSSREEALGTYRQILKSVEPKLSNFLPADTLTDAVSSLLVSAAPSGGPQAYYESGSQDGSRPGVFYVNLNPLESQKKYEAVTLSLHEGNPGHNYQMVFNKQQKDLPRFMANPLFTRYSEAPSRFPMNTAHVEGWGLYSEFLGFEMGLYEEDLYARFGHYSYNLLRACRLVVDTGIHALGWTREEAVDYMEANTALSRVAVEREVDRYITWPGQATAYKVGERKIRELRKSASAQMGERFDLREFHRTILRCLGPLSAVEDCVAAFVAKTLGQDLEQDSEGSRVPEPEIANSGSRNGIGLLLLLLFLSRLL